MSNDSASTTKPNILLFIPDGMQAAPIGPDSQCHTPNFDRLAAAGVRFENAHTTCPTCSPARASLMTGLLPHNHGVLEVEHCRDDDQCVLRTDKPHWAPQLVEAGYRTGYFGKWHIERTNQLEDFGWQTYRFKANKFIRHMGKGDEGPLAEIDEGLSRHVTGPDGYNTILHYAATETPPEERYPGVSLEQTQEFLGECLQDDQPWCCCISFTEPNEALLASHEALAHYDIDNIELPANLRDDYSNRPNLYRRVQQVFDNVTDQEWKEAIACYYARITELDKIFGAIYDQLEEAEALDNTIIIMVADHGRYVGSHGFDAHNFGAFEEIYNIPLIMAGPGIAQGSTSQALVGIHDLYPTILELAGATPVEGLDAKSFAKELAAPGTNGDTFSEGYAEYFGSRFSLIQRVLWHGPWKMIFNGFDFDELYNLEEDPAEMNNLAHDEQYQDLVQDLVARIWRIIRDSGDRAILETHYYPMRFAAVGPNAAK